MYWSWAVLSCVAYRWAWRWRKHAALQVVSIYQTTRCCKQEYHNMNKKKTLVLCNTCTSLVMSMPWNWYSWLRHWNKWQGLNLQCIDTTLSPARLSFGFKLGLCSCISDYLVQNFYTHFLFPRSEEYDISYNWFWPFVYFQMCKMLQLKLWTRSFVSERATLSKGNNMYMYTHIHSHTVL